MSIVVRLLLITLLIVLLLRVAWKFLQSVVEGARGPHTPAKGVRMVRDPVCGTWLVPSRALTSANEKGTEYFCSERCRQAWAAR